MAPTIQKCKMGAGASAVSRGQYISGERQMLEEIAHVQWHLHVPSAAVITAQVAHTFCWTAAKPFVEAARRVSFSFGI